MAPEVALNDYQAARTEAVDLASEIVQVIEQHGLVSVHVDYVGSLHLQIGVSAVVPPFVLVGVYDDKATIGRIADDILAVKSEIEGRRRAAPLS